MSLQPEVPSGLNHIVLNVRDLDRAHDFWTAYLGFRHVGSWHPPGQSEPRMRFYSGRQNGKLHHHDIALFEDKSLPQDLGSRPQTLNHVAIAYSTHEAWRRQIQFLIAKGRPPHSQVERGATYSADVFDPDGNEIELVYERPRADWENDIQAALNHAVDQPVGN